MHHTMIFLRYKKTSHAQTIKGNPVECNLRLLGPFVAYQCGDRAMDNMKYPNLWQYIAGFQ